MSSVRKSLSSPLSSPRDRKHKSLLNQTSSLFHRKTFYFLGNFKQYNDGITQKDLEKAVTNNGGQVALSIHSLTGKNSFLVCATDPNLVTLSDYTNIAKKNKANIVPLSFIIRSLEALSNNHSADFNTLVRPNHDAIYS